MKKSILLFLFSFTISFGFAQDYKITFSYDSAGNQIQRNRVCVNCKSSKQKVVDSTAIISENPKEIENNFSEEHSKLTAYPNPVTNMLKIEWTASKNKVQQIILFTFDNRQLLSRTVDSDWGSLDLNFTNFPIGGYIIVVLYDDHTKQSFKVIKK